MDKKMIALVAARPVTQREVRAICAFGVLERLEDDCWHCLGALSKPCKSDCIVKARFKSDVFVWRCGHSAYHVCCMLDMLAEEPWEPYCYMCADAGMRPPPIEERLWNNEAFEAAWDEVRDRAARYLQWFAKVYCLNRRRGTKRSATANDNTQHPPSKRSKV